MVHGLEVSFSVGSRLEGGPGLGSQSLVPGSSEGGSLCLPSRNQADARRRAFPGGCDDKCSVCTIERMKTYECCNRCLITPTLLANISIPTPLGMLKVYRCLRILPPEQTSRSLPP